MGSLDEGDGRVVMVTGGAAGIGWACCRRFAAAGDRVAILDVDGALASERARDLGGEAIALACDVSSAQQARAALAACLARFGRLDVLVNNAGVVGSSGTPATETSLADFRRLLAVNLSGPHALTQACAEVMARQGGGAMVNLGSAAGFVVSPYRHAYGASKAAVMALTRAMARRLAPLSISVNAVAPGYIRTPLLDALIVGGKVDAAVLEARIPLRRLGLPEEIAEVVHFLSTAKAPSLTGATVVADGGFLAAGGVAGAAAGTAPRPPRTGPRFIIIAPVRGALASAVANAFTGRGDRVLLLGEDLSTLEATKAQVPGDCRVAQADCADEAQAARAIDAAVPDWGDPDVLVITAAESSSDGGDIARSLERDLVGAFVLAKVVGRRLLPRGGSVVFAISADGGENEGAAAAGVLMLARSLACEWAAAGVRVNAVALAPTPSPEQQLQAADAITFLASHAASYMTGSTISLDRRAAPGLAVPRS